MSQLLLRELAERSVSGTSRQELFTQLREVKFSTIEARSDVDASLEPSSCEARLPLTECVLTYEYVEHDLLGLILRKVRLSGGQTKYVIRRTLMAVEVLHDEHREHQFLKSRPFLSSLVGVP